MKTKDISWEAWHGWDENINAYYAELRRLRDFHEDDTDYIAARGEYNDRLTARLVLRKQASGSIRWVCVHMLNVT